MKSKEDVVRMEQNVVLANYVVPPLRPFFATVGMTEQISSGTPAPQSE